MQTASFLPNADTILDPRQKDLILELIRTAKHMATLEELEGNAVTAAMKAVLQEVVQNSCRYVSL